MKSFKRTSKHLISILLVISMLVSVFPFQTFAASTPTLSSESKTVNSGEQFTVSVFLANATSVYGGNFTLQYDSSLLTVDSYEFSSIVSGHTKNCNTNYQSAGNLIRVTFSGATALASSGTLITFTFTAKESVSGSAALQFNAYKMYDENGNAITSTAMGSTITIAPEPVVSPTISVTNKNVTVGSTVSVPIVISDSEAVYGGNFTLQYDSDLLTAESYSFGSIVSGHTTNCNLDYQSAGNLIRVTFSGSEAVSSDGTLITLTFTAKATGTATLQFNAYKMYDENGSSIETTVTNGYITVGEYVEPSIRSIWVFSQPDKEVYLTGEAFDSTGLEICVNYYDGTVAYVKTGFSVSGYNSQKEGQQTLTVSFGGRTATFKVRVDADGIFTITFDANGGSNAPAPITYRDNEYYKVPSEIPTRDGYVFGGWADSPTSTDVYFSAGNSVCSSAAYYGDLTVYAIWIDNVISGQCGDNAYYALTLDTGELVLSGTGPVWDYTVDNYKEIPWNDYAEQIKKVSVESGITKIGDFNFAICNEITDVTLSNTVETVGAYAFHSISELSNVQLGGTLTLGEHAFSWCDNLKSIDLNDVVTIEKSAFNHCSVLNNVVIPETVKEVGETAFGYCYELSKITILADGATFGYRVFDECDSLTEVHINDLAAWCNISFDTSAVNSNPLYIAKNLYIGGILETDITIPESITSINRTFYGCTSIERVTILNKKTTFDYDAFEKHVTILGYTGSKAEYYANSYGLEFIALDGTTVENISISSNPAKTTYYIGDTLNTSGLQLSVSYSDGTTETITSGFTTSGFSSTSAGTKTVTVSYQGYTDTFTVTVKTPSVTLSSSSKTMSVGDTSAITATTTPSGQSITWTSSDTSVATVSNGVVVAEGAGTSTITAKFTYNEITYSKTCNITVNRTLSGIEVWSEPTTTSYFVGDTLNTSGLVIKLTYDDGLTETVTSGFTTSGFSSTTAGTKTVTVSYEGFTDTFTVTVKTPSVLLSSSNEVMLIGDSRVLTTTTTPSNQSVTWTSSNTSVATVSNGVVVAEGAGTATITAKFTYNGITYSKTCSITVNRILLGIEVWSEPNKTSYFVGDTLNTNGLIIKLVYDDGSTETVTSGYSVSGFASTSAGTKTITVSYEGFTDTFTVSVKTPSIVLSSSDKTMNIGEISEIAVTTTPSGQSVTWTSSDTSVATVSNGVVTARGEGTTTITAKFIYNGVEYKKTCSITVLPDPEPVLTYISVSSKPTKTIYYIGDTLSTNGLVLELIYDDGSSETITSGFTVSGFSSSSAGTKTVTVLYEGFTDTFTVTVKTPNVVLSSYSETMNVNDVKSISATTYPDNQNIEWISTDESVVMVLNGVIVAKSAGTVMITARFIYNGVEYKKTCSVTVLPETVQKGTWKQDAVGWWYQNADGTYPYSRFQEIDGVTYYFNASGYMVTGWQSIGGAWYYFNGSGAMVTGWQSIGGTWYYFDGNGAMKTGWQSIGGIWYYFNGSGAMVTGWQSIGGTWYYFNGSGAMATGWQSIGGTWYYFDGSGAMVTGWQSIDGKWYYFEGSGAMVANRWVGNYYLQADGSMATNKWIGNYYVGSDGAWIP